MVVYLDIVIITNLLVDYAFLKTIAILYHEKIKWYRMVIALLVGIISLLLFLVPIKYLYNIRYVIGILMALIAYNSKKPKKRFLMVISFYLINLSFIGSLVIFEIRKVIFLVFAVTYILLLHIFEKILKINYQDDWIVSIDDYQLYGLLDTGNNCVYDNLPIVFIHERFLSEKFTFIDNINVTTINNTNNIDIYQGPIMKINNNMYTVLYCFSEIKDYDIILNKVMEDKIND